MTTISKQSQIIGGSGISKDNRNEKSTNTSGIDVFLRVKPSPGPSTVSQSDFDDSVVKFSKQLRLKIADNGDNDNNSKKTKCSQIANGQAFVFNGVLDQEATQEDVFHKVGIPAVENVLEGYNSTIFAYGQTGSGKTYSLFGPEEDMDFKKRGIIPRAIQHLFDAAEQLQKNSDGQIAYSCSLSYLEIYQDTGYDLLNSGTRKKRKKGEEKIDDPSKELKRVTVLEDEYGNFHFRNLSCLPVNSAQDALQKVIDGEGARIYAETEMNHQSSRSHCIVTLIVEERQAGSDSVVRSKLNMVDLAGSERVHKTHAAGLTLKEAKYINSSLHYLELVILALAEREQGNEQAHVPYRNSMMTSVLRDSLGGNCESSAKSVIFGDSKVLIYCNERCNATLKLTHFLNSHYCRQNTNDCYHFS
jgi:kinesin family protein 6/9